MAAVYSGGLVYEYSVEGNGYGVVNISSDGTVVEGDQFDLLEKAFAGTANPTGDGGYNSTSAASECPVYSSTWNVTSDSLPSIPAKAAAYMKSGAGTGPGLTGKGSQTSGGDGVSSSGTASAGSGSATATATSTSSSSSKSAGVALTFDKTPMILGFIVSSFTFIGACLL